MKATAKRTKKDNESDADSEVDVKKTRKSKVKPAKD